MAIEEDVAALSADRDRLKKALKGLLDFLDTAEGYELERAHRYGAYVDAANALILSV